MIIDVNDAAIKQYAGYSREEFLRLSTATFLEEGSAKLPQRSGEG